MEPQLRLAEFIVNESAFQNNMEILLFHGTHSGHREDLEAGIGIVEGDPTDFGAGFYMTSFSWQALKWAKTRAKESSEQPLLVIAKLKLKKLRRVPPTRTLIIDEYNAAWASTIRAGRTRKRLPYDWIIGRCADRDINNPHRGPWPDDDEELVNVIRPPEDTSMYHFEQIWFGNEAMIKACLNDINIVQF